MVINQTNVVVPMESILAIELKVVARMQCTSPTTKDTYIFSNYRRDNADLQTHYNLRVGDILEQAPSIQRCAKVRFHYNAPTYPIFPSKPN